MALRILDTCTSCAACEEECPPQAISRGDEVFVIDSSLCDECAGVPEGPLCVAACPIDCIERITQRAA